MSRQPSAPSSRGYRDSESSCRVGSVGVPAARPRLWLSRGRWRIPDVPTHRLPTAPSSVQIWAVPATQGASWVRPRPLPKAAVVWWGPGCWWPSGVVSAQPLPEQGSAAQGSARPGAGACSGGKDGICPLSVLPSGPQLQLQLPAAAAREDRRGRSAALPQRRPAALRGAAVPQDPRLAGLHALSHHPAG